MKVLYIDSKLKDLERFNPAESEIQKLPKKLFLAYSLQYKSAAEAIKKRLEENKIKVSNFQQVLGCSKINTKDPILLISEGRFHLLNLFLQSPEVWFLDSNKLMKIPSSEIESLRNKRKSSLIKFLKAQNIGILVSTKPGQENLSLALKIKSQLKRKGKNPYIFLSNNIDLGQFENFKIESWVNTSCYGLSYDNSNIIDYKEI